MSATDAPQLTIVHEGRGGYIEVGDWRYGIEHIHDGGFAIHFPCGNRSPKRFSHRDALITLALAQPEKWALKDHSRKKHDPSTRAQRESASHTPK
jgi:hypothetical protein